MADKITRFEDYVNKEGRQVHDDMPAEGQSEPSEKKARGFEKSEFAGQRAEGNEKPEQGLTQEILSIEIEDPVQFFTEEERQEYYAQMRRKETEDRIKRRTEEERAALQRERDKESSDSGNKPSHDAAAREDRLDSKRPKSDDRRDNERTLRDRRRRPDPEVYDEHDEDEYDEGFDEDEYIDDDDGDETSGVNMDLVVRIASVITGLLILAFIGIAVKVKVFDRYFAADPDETQTVTVSLPAGYTAMDDTVVVSGASSLNLRTVPSTGSDEYIATAVDEGTELKRIAVSEDGKWALVEYNGQQLYVSMKYLKVK